MRKLADAKKLSSSFDGRSIPCKVIPGASKHTDLLHKHPITDYYDFARIRSASIGARSLLNLIVHSYAFVEALRDDFTIGGVHSWRP